MGFFSSMLGTVEREVEHIASEVKALVEERHGAHPPAGTGQNAAKAKQTLRAAKHAFTPGKAHSPVMTCPLTGRAILPKGAVDFSSDGAEVSTGVRQWITNGLAAADKDLTTALRSGSQAIAGFAEKLRRSWRAWTVFPGHQHFGNCGVQSAEQIIHAATGNHIDETTLLNESIKNRLAFDDPNPELRGGTTDVQRQGILAKYGVQSQIEPTTEKNLADALKEGKGVIATVDPGILWDDAQYDNESHAIVVYDADYDANGNITNVYINDTGTGQQGRKVPFSLFNQASDAQPNGGVLNVTDKAVW